MNRNFPPFCPGFDEAMILVERNLRNLRVRWVLQGRKFANNSWVNCGGVANLGRWSGRDFGWRLEKKVFGLREGSVLRVCVG
jgi:hypothetical protein